MVDIRSALIVFVLVSPTWSKADSDRIELKTLPSKARCEFVLTILATPRKYSIARCWKGIRERPSFAETIRRKCLAEYEGKIVVAVSGLQFDKDEVCSNDRYVVAGTRGAPTAGDAAEVIELSLNSDSKKVQYSMRVSAQMKDGGLGGTKMCGSDEGSAFLSGGTMQVESRIVRVDIAGACPSN